MMLLMNLRGLLANILITKKHQFKLKQTRIADMRSNVLNHSIEKDCDDAMHILLRLGIHYARNACTAFQKGVYLRSIRCDLNKIFTRSARVSKTSILHEWCPQLIAYAIHEILPTLGVALVLIRC